MKSIVGLQVFFSLVLLYLLLGSPLLQAIAESSSAELVLKEGDYAVYIGALPQVVLKKREDVVTYHSPVLGEVKPGPWLVEWCVVRDYGNVSVLLVHVYYRFAERVEKTEKEAGERVGDYLDLVAPSTPDKYHRLVERDRVFLVVLDKKRSALISSNGSIIASWVYTLGPRGWEAASRLAGGHNLSRGVPLVLPGYYVDEAPVPRRSFLAYLRKNAYIVFSPRAIVSGPYTVFEATWAPRLGDINSSSSELVVPSSVAKVVRGLFGRLSAPGGLTASVRVVFFGGIYEISRGVLLLYDTYVDPLMLVAEGFNATRVFIDERVLEYVDAVVMSKEAKRVVERLGGSIYISHGLMFLYNSSLLDPGERRQAVLHPPSGVRLLVDYAVSKSLFAKGCRLEALRSLNASFIGGWSWSLLEEKYASRAETATSTSTSGLQATTSIVQRGEGSWWLGLAALSIAVIGLGVGLVLYEKRVSSRAGKR